MAGELGTRTRTTLSNSQQDQGAETRSHTRDIGMTKLVSGSALTYTAATARIAGANGDFAAFAVGDPVLSQGTNLNNGYFQVTGLNAVNQAYITVSPAPKDEGPVATAIVRTA